MHLSDRKRWNQNPPLPRSHLRVGSRGEGILLEIFVYLGPSKGKQILYFCVHSFCIWAGPHLLRPRTLLLFCHCCTFHHVTTLQLLKQLVTSEDNLNFKVVCLMWPVLNGQNSLESCRRAVRDWIRSHRDILTLPSFFKVFAMGLTKPYCGWPDFAFKKLQLNNTTMISLVSSLGLMLTTNFWEHPITFFLLVTLLIFF